MARRHELTDEQRKLIEDLFPNNGHRGGQWKDHRTMVDGLLWWLRTGAQWRDLPERYGPWKTVYDRFRRWHLRADAGASASVPGRGRAY